MKKGSKLQVALLCLVPFIMVLGNSMLIPVLPQIKKAVGINQFQVGLLITAFSVPAGLTIPFAGILSDQIGRRKVMAPALVLYGLGGIVAGISSMAMRSPFWGILAGRIVQGIGAGGTYQLAMAIVGDTFKSRERVFALGLLEASNGLGKVVSPVLGTAFALVTWFFPFFAYGFLAIPTGIALFLFVKEKAEFKKQAFSDYLTAVKHIFRQKAPGLLSSFKCARHGGAFFPFRNPVSLLGHSGEKIWHLWIKKGPYHGRAGIHHGSSVVLTWNHPPKNKK